MPERWRRELEKVDRMTSDLDRIRARAQAPSRFPVGPGSRRSRVAAAVSAIVVFALAVSVFVIPTLRASRGEPTPTAPASPSPSFVPGAPKADALAEARRLVGLTQVPPGSQALSESPVRALRTAPGGFISCATEPCDTALDITAWWSMPLPMDAAISWLQTHPPAGLSLNGDHGSQTASGRITAVSWTYQDGPAPAYTRAELTLAVAAEGADNSVLRADGQVLWVPPRTDAEHVPADIGRVRLVEYRGNEVIAHRVLTGALATRLAGFLNHLGRINMGPPRAPEFANVARRGQR
jgi:hypothetical protein